MKQRSAFKPPVKQSTLFAAAVVSAVAVIASPASASCINSTSTFCDTTRIEAFSGSQFDSSYKSNGFSSGIGDVLQSASDPFNTDKLVTKLTEGRTTETLELTFYTSFNGNELGAHYADIFLGSNIKSPDSFDYGIALGNQTDSSGLYQVTSSSDYETSEQVWSGKKGAIYGGAYRGMDGQWDNSPTVLSRTATQDGAFTTTVTEATTKADPGYGHIVDVKLTASVTDFNALFGSGLSVFWGTADCSNDAIEAIIAYAPTYVPEPLTLSLLGAGLGGLLWSVRRKGKRL